jgi:oxygen-dependent protoporphyrinogen oxidase
MTRDVVIVGGGIAGLTAAWQLRHRDVLLLEASECLGGRMRSQPLGPYWLNYGAHLFPAPGTLVDRLATECGLETVPVRGSMMGLAVGSTLLTSGRAETYPFRLPLSLRDRVAFARAGLAIRRAVARSRRPDLPPDAEDHRTFGDLLGSLPPAVREIFSCAAHRATAELDELSAACGISLFALVWGGSGSLIARNLLGGTGRLPEALGRALGERARTGCAVHAIRPDGSELVVEHEGSEERARHVIVAAQAPHAAPLVADVAPQAADALCRLAYGPFLVVAVETRETGPMPYDDVYAIATPGRAFDLFTNQANALRGSGPRRPGGSLMLFAGGGHAAELARQPDDVVAARFLADLQDLYPQTRGVMAATHVHRWELGNVFARPGRSRLQPALEGPLGPHANLHLAGDHVAPLGNMEAAAQSGRAAAAHIDTRLREAVYV